jgi:hypothetical protein
MTNDFEKDSYDMWTVHVFMNPTERNRKAWGRADTVILPGVYHYLPKRERRGKLPRKEDPDALNFCDKAFVPDDKAYGITTIEYFCDGLVLSCDVCSDLICSVCLSSLLDPQTCAYVMIKIPPAMGPTQDACFVLLCVLRFILCMFCAHFVQFLCPFCAVLCRNLAQKFWPFFLKNVCACFVSFLCRFWADVVPTLCRLCAFTFLITFKEFFKLYMFLCHFCAYFCAYFVSILCLFCAISVLFWLENYNIFGNFYIFGNFVPTLYLLCA